MERPLKQLFLPMVMIVAICFSFTVGALADSKAVGRVKQIQPLTGEKTSGNAGFFVGVGKFDEKSELAALNFTTDDAVALAHLFVAELKLIPPGNARVALGGEPKSSNGLQQMASLKALKVPFVSATRENLLDTMNEVCDLVQEKDALIVMSFSSHGYEERGLAYIMPSNGRRRLIRSTGVPLQEVKDSLRRAPGNKKLLFMDACREPLEASTRGKETMSQGLLNALRKAEGIAFVSSCAAGQLSWEAPQFQQGVFTHFLLEALHGAAPSDPRDGLIRLEHVAKYAIEKTREWVRANKSTEQEPFMEAGGAADIPLAWSMEDRDAAEKRKGRAGAALGYLSQALTHYDDLLPVGVYDNAKTLLTTLSGPDLDELVENLEGLKEKRRSKVILFVSWWEDWIARTQGTLEAAPTPIATAPKGNPLATPRVAFASTPATSAAATDNKKKMTIDIAPGVKLTLVRVAAGAFTMGSPNGRALAALGGANAQEKKQQDNTDWARIGVLLGTGYDIGNTKQTPVAAPKVEPPPSILLGGSEGGPATRVILSEDFWISETEITQAQWRAIMGTTIEQQQTAACAKDNLSPAQLPLRGTGDDFPMYFVSWREATLFCGKLPRVANETFSLPTEAQWEFACRAGSGGRYCYGDSDAKLMSYGWFNLNTGGVNSVKAKRPNEWGVYDMHGNVAEWCLDLSANYPTGPVEDPVGVNNLSDWRVIRGGAWSSAPAALTSTFRFRAPPGTASSEIGFRVVCPAIP